MEQIAEQLNESETETYGSGSEGIIYKISIIDKDGKKHDLLIAKKRFDNKPEKETQIHKQIEELTQEGDIVQVPKLRGTFEYDGYNYITMDFIKGKTLYQMIVEAILKKQADLMISNSLHKTEEEKNIITSDAIVLKRMVDEADSDEKIANVFLRFCHQNREKLDAMYTKSLKSKIKLFGNQDGKEKKEAIQKFLNMIHKNGYYHRDLHEKNIIFGEDGKIYIIDFGKSIYRDPKLGKPSKNEIYEEQVGELIGRYCDDEDIISMISGFTKTEDDEEAEIMVQQAKEQEKRLTSGEKVINCLDENKLKSKSLNSLMKKINKLFGSFENFKIEIEKEKKNQVKITSLTGGIEESDLLKLLFSQTEENLDNLLNTEIPQKKNMELGKLKQKWIDKYGKDDWDNSFENQSNDIDEQIKKLQEFTKNMRNKKADYEKYYSKMDFLRELKPFIKSINELIEIQKVEKYLKAIYEALQ